MVWRARCRHFAEADARSPPGRRRRPRHESEGLLEAMNLLRANLEFSPNGVAGPTILVTSALAREGKTTVAANLASVLAMGGHNVICVEADARRPALRGYMGVPAQTEGLLEVLNGDVDLDRALQLVDLVGPGSVEPRRMGLGRKNGARPEAQQAPFVGGELRLLPIGSSSRVTGMVFSAEKLGPLINELRARADFVIFDSSPLLTLADSFLLAQLSDDVLVVARQGQTKKDKAQAVRARLKGLGVERIGVILTELESPRRRGYYSVAAPARKTSIEVRPMGERGCRNLVIGRSMAHVREPPPTRKNSASPFPLWIVRRVVRTACFERGSTPGRTLIQQLGADVVERSGEGPLRSRSRVRQVCLQAT